MPSASAEQLATFERGRTVMASRFDLADGLGPTFNVSFCGACHEKPVFGGSAGLYRNFVLAGRVTTDGAFFFSESNGDAGGVMRVFDYGESAPARPVIPDTTTVFAQRSAIPTFGMGLIAELSEEELLSRSDPDDADGDGISGRPNFDDSEEGEVFVGRFGRKAQTVSIEGFIRGPLFNHLGITTDPLSDVQRAALPVDSSSSGAARVVTIPVGPPNITQPRGPHQAAAPSFSNSDDDGIADPEMSSQDLFDLVSFVMLLAAPELDEPTEQSNRGRLLFHEVGCAACHAPRLEGPRGPIPAYSDFLLHNMGDALADGILMGEAQGDEFRTQPLWGLAGTGPYLHDGRAHTIDEAIRAHGGEAQAANDAYAALTDAEREDVEAFLMSLGGRSQFTAGLLPPDAGVPVVGEPGGPSRALSDIEMAQFVRGREVFDRDFGFSDGAGALAGPDGAGRFNGDSCRACHFDPVIGGSGPRGVNVMRHGVLDADGVFAAPADTPNTILHKHSQIGFPLVGAGDAINVFEHRQTPHAFGLGLIDGIADDTVIANADPDDADGNGISGRAHILSDGRLGKLGWKADVPTTAEFIRDAMAAEIGLTLPLQEGLSFGLTEDDDDVPDPELAMSEVEDINFFLTMLGGPPRDLAAGDVSSGEEIFTRVGCALCHIPSLSGADGDVLLFSDLLLHDILPDGQPGIVSGSAGQREFRTAPLWGLRDTAPYLHDGTADTIDEAIRRHDGEAAAVRAAYEALDSAERDALVAFLDTL
jgi:CxxC motif-containing protein (DUF1111 family)